MEERLDIGTKIYWIAWKDDGFLFAESEITRYQNTFYAAGNYLSVVTTQREMIPASWVFATKQEAFDDVLKKIEALKGDLKDDF